MSIVDGFLVTKLIELIKTHRCIYDPRNEHHSNRAVINSVWKSIAMEMGQPETLCREKWINLRSNFARELRKTRRKMYEEGGTPSSQWIFYDVMMFLAPFVKTRLATVESMNDQDEVRIKLERDQPFVEVEPIVDEQSDVILNGTFDMKRKHPDEEMDDDKLFLLSLHSKLKELPLLDNLSFRIEVHTLLLEKLKAAMAKKHKSLSETSPSSPEGKLF